MRSLLVLFGFGLVLSGIAIRMGIPLSQRLGIIDRPGGHKVHDHSTPFVGGIGVFVALLGTLSISGYFSSAPSMQWWAVALGGTAMFLTGLVDDVRNLGFRIRFAIQTGVALVMVLGGGVVLTDLGRLGFGHMLELGFLAIPFTVIATIGVINALNMIDGVDGLSGSVSLASLFMLFMVAFGGGAWGYAILAVGLMGGVAGFLYFNMRHPWQRRARVFLGDNGSMLLGFLFAWMFIALSQGPIRVITPVTALWLFSIPLMDTVSVMLRRLWLGKSPFRPDRHHLHHLFIRAGFRVQDVVYAVVLIHLTLGAIGILGLQMDVPEAWMLAAFLLIFAAYFYLIARPWRFVPSLRQLHMLLGLASPDTRGVFLGNFDIHDAQDLIAGIACEMMSRDDYRLRVYQTEHEGRQTPYVYAVLEVLAEDNDAAVEEVSALVQVLKRRFKGKSGIRVRHLIVRNADNDRRVGKQRIAAKGPDVERRSRHRKILLHTSHGNTSLPMAALA